MPYSYDEETIREVRDRSDIVEIISQYVELKRAGSNYKGLCPFHNEKTPSMVVSPDKQMFRCFGCGEGGDVISFLSKYRNMDFKEVIIELAERANVELKQKTDEDIERERRLKLLYEINREAAIFFYKNLTVNQKPMEYLFNRGIDRKTIKRFGLGYAKNGWSSLLDHLKRKGYKEVDIETAGLAINHKEKKSYYDRFRDRIIFPIWDINSRVIGFGGRLLEPVENQPKYLNSPDTPVFLKGKNLYGLNLIKESIRGKKIILVEGYMDVISLFQNGIENAIASLGTALTRDQVRLIKRYTEDMVLSYDSDEAGINATKKAVDIVKSEGLAPKVMEIERGLDPDDYIKKYGRERFAFKVETAVHYIDFIINLNKQKYNLDILEDKLKFIREISYWLRTIDSPVELELYLNKVAGEIGVPVDTVRGELKSKSKSFKIKNERNDDSKKFIAPVREISANSGRQMEMELLNLILNKNVSLDKIDVKISAEDFQDDINRIIAKSFLELDEESRSDKLFRAENSERLMERIDEIKSLELFLEENQKQKAIVDYARKLRIQSLKQRKKHILDKIGKLESGSTDENSSKEDFRALCRELTEIDRDIKRY